MSRRRLRPFVVVIAVALAALFAAARPAAAEDVVTLRTGVVVRGRIVAQNEKCVTIEHPLKGGGFGTVTIQMADVKGIDRGPPPLAAPPAAGTTTPASAREEWWLLTSGGRVVGTRQVLAHPLGGAAGKGVRLEETVSLFSTPRFPAVLVQRIEEIGEDWLPRVLYYREKGEGGTGRGATPAYETIRSGDVKGGVWSVAELAGGGARDYGIAVPAGAQSPLGAREALARANPRVAGLREVVLVDPARGDVRKVRAGFSSLGAQAAAGEAREDVMRFEEGDVVRESRWASAPEVRCLRDEVVPGIVATPATKAQADAAKLAAEGVPPPPPDPLSPDRGTAEKPVEKRAFTLPEVGITLELPGASWEAVAIPVRLEEGGQRAVAKIRSPLLGADVRIEWDPNGAPPPAFPPAPAGTDPAAAEAESTLLVRLRQIAPDLEVVETRRAAPGVPGAFRMSLRGTVRRERLRTAVLVADRGRVRVVLLASCPENAWEDARGALEAMLDSFRWL